MTQHFPLLSTIRSTTYRERQVGSYNPLVFANGKEPIFSLTCSSANSGSNLNLGENVLYFVTEGSIKIGFNDIEFKLEAKDMILLSKDIQFSFDQTVDPKTGYFCALYFHIQRIQVLDFYAKHCLPDGPKAKPYMPLVHTANSGLLAVCQDISVLCKSQKDVFTECLRHKQDELLLNLLSSNEELFLSVCQAAREQDDDLLGMVERHCLDDCSVAEIAQRCGMNNRQFTILIKTHFQCTPKQWIREKLLAKALILISVQSMNIEEVSKLSGFRNVKYFRETFKKRYKLTPQQYKISLYYEKKHL